MQVQEKQINDIVALVLNGRLDASAVQTLRNRIIELMQKNQINLVMDFDGVDFADSAGLGALVSSQRTVNKAGGDIKISSLKDHVLGVFKSTRLHRLFDIYENVQDAVNQF